MKKIFELEQHIADLIAAGEVVERPASVVKELLENSIDAGAGVITVEIKAGGMTYIRVTDNGCGIAPEDATTAFLRHATSKLRDAEGLEAIGTLGFRGEALAAIAAVSRIEMLTREHGAREGVSLTLEAGTVSDISPAGCPEGTNIIVRDLFYNTPARLKFVKSDRAESSAVASAVLRCALSRPDVSIRFIKDGRTEYHTPGDSRMDSCIYSLFGREFSAGLIPAETTDETLTVSGYVSVPAAARGNRSYQFFVVNGRPIQSRTLQAALEKACENTLPTGRYPSCILYITTSFSAVDVNVHPAKTEIKFVSDKQAFDGVYYAVLSAVTPRQEPQRERSESDTETNARNEQGSGSIGSDIPGARPFGTSAHRPISRVESAPQNSHSGTGKPGGGFKTMQAGEFLKAYGPKTQTSAEGQKTRIPNFDHEMRSPSFRVIGEALNTYIIVEHKNSMWLIDKHAAHERIHFDALKRYDFEPMSQALIAPVVCRHGAEDISILLENAELLEKLGFAIESFGDDAVAVRRIPAEIDISDTEAVLSDMCDQLKLGGAPSPAQQDEIYRAIACKAAIKAGKSSDAHELETLTARVLSGEAAQCPHGRPVAFEITKTFLDRGFKRS